MIAVLIHDGIHAAFSPAADEERALSAQHHASRVGHTARVDRNRKSGRQLEAVQLERAGAQTLRMEDHREQRGDEGTETNHHGHSSKLAGRDYFCSNS